MPGCSQRSSVLPVPAVEQQPAAVFPPQPPAAAAAPAPAGSAPADLQLRLWVWVWVWVWRAQLLLELWQRGAEGAARQQDGDRERPSAPG